MSTAREEQTDVTFSCGLLYMNTPVLSDPQKLNNIHQHCVDTGFYLEDLPSVIADRDRW